jgi:predicted permease
MGEQDACAKWVKGWFGNMRYFPAMDPTLLLRIVSILFPLFAVVSVGFLYGRRFRPDMTFANRLNMDLFVPALVFAALAREPLDLAAYQGIALGALGMIAVCGLLAWPLARALGIAPKTFAPVLMFNNSGNLGLPLSVLAFGESALAAAVVLFVVSNLVHFAFGAWLLDRHVRPWSVWRNPVVVASVGGVLVSAAEWQLWGPLMQGIGMLGDISIPLLLFSLGVRLTDTRLEDWRVGVLGAAARPISGMLACWGIGLMLGLSQEQQALLLVFGALPPAVLNYVFAEHYNQEPQKVASMVLIGNLGALVFLPFALALTLV